MATSRLDLGAAVAAREAGRGAASAMPGGFAVLLTGLSGSGKTTLAVRLAQRWERRWGRPMTVLDGDEARAMLSSELGFSREHRELNVARLGYVAGEVARHGGACVVAAIAPHEEGRARALEFARRHGAVFLVHVCTPIEVCEARDSKGLYAKARSGFLPGFTGVGDPYEEPGEPDLRLDLGTLDTDEACALVEWLLPFPTGWSPADGKIDRDASG